MTRTTDLGAELERLKAEAEQAVEAVADQVLALLDEKGLGGIVRARLANGDGGGRSVEAPKKKGSGRVKVRVWNAESRCRPPRPQEEGGGVG